MHKICQHKVRVQQMIIVKIPKAQVHLGSKGEKTKLDSPLYSQPGPEVRKPGF